jgi:WD40 repeat protein/serine/threonine protein kinase
MLDSSDDAVSTPGFGGTLATGLPAAAADLAMGQHFGDYELIEEISRGGMGVVYRARQVSLDRIVAVKLLLAGLHAGADFVQRFRTEAAAAASLRHPNIVAIHEVGFAEGQHFFAMDYVEGLTLAQHVAKGSLPVRDAARYLRTIAEAIHFAHERNVLHRDLKPSNVLIDSATDQPRLTDFGLAKRLESETDLTVSGQVLGSPNYMSPEQAVGKRGTVGKQSDIYSLGAILYHLLTGRAPFQGETLTDVLHQVVNDDPISPHLLTPRVPRDLETICLKCLEKEPSRRYQTAQRLADELSRFLRDEPILARPVGRIENLWRWCRRKPALASLALVFILGFSGTVWEWRKASRERQRADQSLYESDMSLAQHAWDDGDLGYALNRLQAHLPRAAEVDRRNFVWFYFWKLCQGEQVMTLPHSQTVNSVAFSPDGKRVATGCGGNGVQIWDTATGKMVKRVPVPDVVSLAFAPDGQKLGVGGRYEVMVWDLQAERAVFRHEDPRGQFRIAFLRGGTLLAIGKHGRETSSPGPRGGDAEVWDYRADKQIYDFPKAGGRIAVSGASDLLATGNSDEGGDEHLAIKIWNVATGSLVRSIRAGKVIAMAFSPDGRNLATSDSNDDVVLWDVTTGRRDHSFTNNEHTVWSLAFSADGKFLVTGGADQTVSVLDVATCQVIDKFRGHGSEVVSIAVSPDSQTLASGSKDETAMLWSLHPDRPLTTLSNIIADMPIFSPDGRLIAAGIGNNQVATFEVTNLQVRALFNGAEAPVGFLDNGHTLVTRGTNFFLKTFDVASGAVIAPTLPQPVIKSDSYVARSPDGHLLVEGLANGTIVFHDARSGAMLSPQTHAYASNVFKIVFSPNGKLLATAGIPISEKEGWAAKIWSTETYQVTAAPAGHTDLVLELAFSPDGKTLATCAVDDTIRFWNTTTWKEIAPALRQREFVNTVAYSPDGGVLASAAADGRLILWNVATRHELASLKLEWPYWRSAFSPDGQNLAMKCWGNTIHLLRAPVLGKDQLRLRGP